MLNIGMTELLCFAIIALLVLGPEKLPEAARFAAKWYGKIKRLISNVQTDIDRELRMSELREEMQKEMQRIQQLEARMQAQMNEFQQSQHPIELTAVKQQVAVAPENKNTSPRYHYIEQVQGHHLMMRQAQFKYSYVDSRSRLTTRNTIQDFKVAV